jgi:hypothetical protein
MSAEIWGFMGIIVVNGLAFAKTVYDNKQIKKKIDDNQNERIDNLKKQIQPILNYVEAEEFRDELKNKISTAGNKAINLHKGLKEGQLKQSLYTGIQATISVFDDMITKGILKDASHFDMQAFKENTKTTYRTVRMTIKLDCLSVKNGQQYIDKLKHEVIQKKLEKLFTLVENFIKRVEQKKLMNGARIEELGNLAESTVEDLISETIAHYNKALQA